jgi:CRISPR/Cas system endoribonuclease Cas6 (RAMP superfamily)
MVEDAEPRTSWRLMFVTPTAFRSGNTDQVMPQTGSVIGHYRRVWSEFAPDRDESNVDLSAAMLSIASLKGETVEMMGRFRRRFGFVGEIEIKSDSSDKRLRSRIDALIAVAPFSGTGTDTTAGMGVTRWMD